MVSKVSPAGGQEQGLEKVSEASTELEMIQKIKEESGASGICSKIEETGDCCSRSVNEVEVENHESGIWLEVKNARVLFSWGDFFYALFLGLGPTVCTILSKVSDNTPHIYHDTKPFLS